MYEVIKNRQIICQWSFRISILFRMKLKKYIYYILHVQILIIIVIYNNSNNIQWKWENKKYIMTNNDRKEL